MLSEDVYPSFNPIQDGGRFGPAGDFAPDELKLKSFRILLQHLELFDKQMAIPNLPYDIHILLWNLRHTIVPKVLKNLREVFKHEIEYATSRKHCEGQWFPFNIAVFLVDNATMLLHSSSQGEMRRSWWIKRGKTTTHPTRKCVMRSMRWKVLRNPTSRFEGLQLRRILCHVLSVLYSGNWGVIVTTLCGASELCFFFFMCLIMSMSLCNLRFASVEMYRNCGALLDCVHHIQRDFQRRSRCHFA